MPNPLSVARCAADRTITNPYKQVYLALGSDPYEFRNATAELAGSEHFKAGNQKPLV
jgi:hypothetical protein